MEVPAGESCRIIQHEIHHQPQPVTLTPSKSDSPRPVRHRRVQAPEEPPKREVVNGTPSWQHRRRRSMPPMPVIEGMRPTAEVAKAWGVSVSQVGEWCREGRLPGAKQVPTKRGRPSWYIPIDAERPKPKTPKPRKRKPSTPPRSYYTPVPPPPPVPEGTWTATEAAEIWGVSLGLVQRWCREGHIPGVSQVFTGKTRPKWYIPQGSEKPQREDNVD